MTHPRRLGVIVLVLTAAAMAYVATSVSLDSDYAAFLPAGASPTQRTFMTELREGAASRVVLIELGGAAPADLAATSRKLAAALAASADFRYVNNGESGMGERELALIAGHRYLLSDRLDGPAPFSAAALRTALDERLEALSGSAGMLEKRFLANDPTGETRRILGRIVPAKAPQRIEGVWFDATATHALLLAETRASGSDLARQDAAFAALAREFAASRAAPSIAMEFSSAGAMAVRSRALIASDARTLSLASMAGVLAILFWAYRSLRVVALCAIPAALGLLGGIVTVNLLFGSIHGITLAFGATLLGESVDYPSYLLTQVMPGVSASEAGARIGRTLRLAVLTTACGALALLFGGFPGLAQLGVLTITGVLVAGAATWWVLPSFVPRQWSPVAPPAWLVRRVAAPGRQRMSRWSRRAIAAVAALGAVAAAWSKPWWDDDLASMSPLPASMKAQDARLRGAMGAPDVRFALTIEGRSREDVLVKTEAIRSSLERAVAARSIAGFDLVTDYLPSEATQARRRQALPDPDVLRANLAAAADGLPFRLQAFEPFVEDVARARSAPPLTQDAYEGSALRLKVEGLLHGAGSEWQVVVPLAGVSDSSALERVLPSGVHLLDMRAEATSMMSAYRKQAVHSSSIGLVLIFAVLAFGLRSFTGACKVLGPILLAAVTTGALLIAAGEPLTVFHYVALLLTIGIGVNYALVMASAQARDDRAGMWRTLAVVSGTALVTFGLLALAHAPVLHAIGITVCIGIVLSLALATLLIDAPPAAERAG